jgi:phospholipid/cholesterol/gamma-HCH transport system substrate-binding protein
VTLEIRNILVGSFAVVAGVLFLVFSSRGGVEASAEGYELRAVYQNIDGVSVGTNVLLAGIKVGKVTELKHVPDGHRAEIAMRIRKDIELPIDSIALVISAGMLGGKYIKLEPGGEMEVFAAGDYFEYVQGAVIFEELLQKIVLDAEGRRRKAKKARAAAEKSEPLKKNNPFGSLLK